ncbi:MAG: fimbrillin family protein [Bacteroidaceae bacterium]|nr:fimbrillin family protein [Bacteroidaceae bacterium]
MKKIYKYTALAVFALGFTACSQDDDFTPQQEDIVQIASANIATEVQTRVNTLGDGTLFENADQILLVNGSRTSKNNGTYTYDGTNWNLTTGTILYASSGTNDFTAYYPAVTEADYTLPTDQSTLAGIKMADRMVATTTGVAKGTGVALSFERQNAKVTITPTFASEYDGKGIADIQNFKIEEVAPYLPENGTAYTAILEPSGTGFSVTLTVGSDNLTATSTTALEAGKHYSFNLTVGKEAVSINSVSVNDWTEKPVSGVEAEQEAFVYNPATNTYEVHLSRGMQAAIDAAELTGTAENPATVTLLADMEVEGTPNEYGDIMQDILVDGGVIVLDLNGHTLKTANTSDYLIWLQNGATLTINDSSEEKCGKMITYDWAYDVIYAESGKLVINGGTFEGTDIILGWDNSSTIEINGGTFIGTDYAIYSQSSILTITGGTFTAGKSALDFTSNGKPTITGGSFSGGEYDINTANLTGFLSYNEETGEGPTFPGGLSISGTSNNLKALLVTGAAYFDAEGNQLTLASNATTYDEGDVTVKKMNE